MNDNDNDTRTEYTSNTVGTSYTLINSESDLRCSCFDECIAGCIFFLTDVINYIFCCLCCYIEEDD